MEGGEAGRKAWESLSWRAQGKTYEEIAALVGYANRAGARAAVMRALKARDEELSKEQKHSKAQVYSRYMELFKVAAEAALGGDMSAMPHAIKLADRLASIEGVAPREETLRVQVTSELDREIADLMAALDAQRGVTTDAGG